MTLTEIFNKHGTDKGSVHEYTAHNYGPVYESYLGGLRYKPIKMLEIGVGGGESIRAWLEYFPEVELFGVDIVQRTNPWNDPDSSPDKRYKFIHNDQNDRTGWACFLADAGTGFDVIVEDGSHENIGMITSFDCLFPSLKSPGAYFIEDVGAGYTPGSVHVKPGAPSHKDWLGSLVEDMHTGKSPADFIGFTRELVAILKA